MAKEAWVIDLNTELYHTDSGLEPERWKRLSIYRVPKSLTDLNDKAYKPRVVSFGPYHHGEEQLRPMEEHKRRVLLHFLRRAGKKVDEFVKAMRLEVEKLMDAYEGLESRWRENPDRFLQLMITDGCFMLEILRAADVDYRVGYAENDPVFSDHGELYTMPYIRRDMLMLENQLPFLVLHSLLAVEGSEKKEDLNRLLLNFLHVPPEEEKHCHDKPLGGLHVLDVYRNSKLLKNSRQPLLSDGDIKTASKLHDSGVHFEKSGSDSFTDISFSSKDGKLQLPYIVVDDATETTLRNLLAFERLHVGAGNQVTSYVFFMDGLIDTARDVYLLSSGGIIQPSIGSDESVAKLFNDLATDLCPQLPSTGVDDKNVDKAVSRQLVTYCKKYVHRCRAYFHHTYLTNFWIFLGLVGAIILGLLTLIQTVYSALSYHPI